MTPPIPASATHRPLNDDGLVVPFTHDGQDEYRELCWRRGLCSVCAAPARPAVILSRAAQLENLLFRDPPLCPPCAIYTAKACPHIADPVEPWFAVYVRHVNTAITPDGLFLGALGRPELVVRVQLVSTPGTGPVWPWAPVPGWVDDYTPIPELAPQEPVQP